jgi:hypothetical protein
MKHISKAVGSVSEIPVGQAAIPEDNGFPIAHSLCHQVQNIDQIEHGDPVSAQI